MPQGSYCYYDVTGTQGLVSQPSSVPMFRCANSHEPSSTVAAPFASIACPAASPHGFSWWGLWCS
jgi:hypothetical protein